MSVENEACGLNILALVPEAYGGFGGIAAYNIDFFDALCTLPAVREVQLAPRHIHETPYCVPSKIELITSAQGGLGAYCREVVRLAGRCFDLIICTHMYLLPFARMASHITGTPIICVLYGVEAWQPTRRFLVDRLVQRCGTLISISDFTAQQFQQWSGVPDKRISLLPNAIREEKFGLGEWPGYLVERYGTQGCRVIMTLGRLDGRERQKGIDEMIALMPRLLATSADLRYLIVGDGDDRPRLEDKVEYFGLSGKVIFCGRVTDAEKADHYRLADVFSMVGRQEGFGFVFLEALACGTPVIASRLDGSRDAVLGGELGELANPDQPDTVVKALERAFSKQRAIPARLEHFSFENFTRRLDRAIAPYAEEKIRRAVP